MKTDYIYSTEGQIAPAHFPDHTTDRLRSQCQDLVDAILTLSDQEMDVYCDLSEISSEHHSMCSPYSENEYERICEQLELLADNARRGTANAAWLLARTLEEVWRRD